MNCSVRLILLSVALNAITNSVNAATHCKPGEIVYFSCTIKDSSKVVSLCGNGFKNAQTYERNAKAWLQYRFGRLGSKLELEYPTERANSLSLFSGEYQHPYQAFIHGVSFRIGRTTYEVALNQFEGDNFFYGIYVDQHGTTKELPCDKKPQTDFAPDDNNFFSLVLDLHFEKEKK